MIQESKKRESPKRRQTSGVDRFERRVIKWVVSKWLCPFDAKRELTAQKKPKMLHVRWQVSEADKGHVRERVKLTINMKSAAFHVRHGMTRVRGIGFVGVVDPGA